jgi:hypothetical protein
VIALGDVSVTGKEIAVTHTHHGFVKAKPDGVVANPSLTGFPPLIPGQKTAVFDGAGRSALRHGAGSRLAAGLNARSL